MLNKNNNNITILIDICFFVGIWSWLADKLSFHPYKAGFYKPTVHKVHPPFCRITAYATMPG